MSPPGECCPTSSLSRLIAFPCLPRRLLLVDAASGLSPSEASWVPSLFWRCELWLSTVLTCRGSHHAQLRTTRRQIGHHGEVAIEQPLAGGIGTPPGDGARRRDCWRPVRRSSGTVR